MLSIIIFTFLFLRNDISHIAIAYSLGDLPADPDGDLLVCARRNTSLASWGTPPLSGWSRPHQGPGDTSCRAPPCILCWGWSNRCRGWRGWHALGNILGDAHILILSLSISHSPRTLSLEDVRGEASWNIKLYVLWLAFPEDLCDVIENLRNRWDFIHDEYPCPAQPQAGDRSCYNRFLLSGWTDVKHQD